MKKEGCDDKAFGITDLFLSKAAIEAFAQTLKEQIMSKINDFAQLIWLLGTDVIMESIH